MVMFLSLGNLELELCYQPSFTHNSVTHRHLCHTPSVLRGRLRFAWQAWHLATSTFVSRGRCGTWSHSPSFRVAGVALMALGFVLRGRRGAYGTGLALVARLSALGRAWARLIAGDAKTLRGRCGTWRHPFSFRVAGVALGHIHLRFVWQAWHLWHWASFCVAGVALMALGWLKWRLGALGRAWSLVTPPNFAWQAWHLATSTFVSRGRCGRFDFDPPWEEIGCQADDIGALARKKVRSDAACQCLAWTQFMFCAGLHFLIQQ